MNQQSHRQKEWRQSLSIPVIWDYDHERPSWTGGRLSSHLSIPVIWDYDHEPAVRSDAPLAADAFQFPLYGIMIMNRTSFYNNELLSEPFNSRYMGL